MAVDKYVHSTVEAGKIVSAALVNGARVIGMTATEEIDADGDGSVYRFFKGVSGNLIPYEMKVYVDDAVTLAVDTDIGLYNPTAYNGDDGAVIDVDVFADSLDLAPSGGALPGTVAGATETPADGLCSIDIADRTKKIYELAGHTALTAKPGYDICVTTNTDTGAAGTVTIVALFLET
jgi:hypothetical protein